MKFLAVLPVLFAFLAGALPAHAWTWPVEGPVLQPFLFGGDPYAAGQHRGADIGAPSGHAVRAPAGGVVSFAGTVPANGRSVTIATADGYSVTLVHLGSITVSRGASVDEGANVGTVGPSGDAEHPEPYVHLGVRVTADPHGYVDPLGLLPARPGTPAEPSGEPASGSADPGSPAEVPVADPTSAEPEASPEATQPEIPVSEVPMGAEQPVADAPTNAPVSSAEEAEAPQTSPEVGPETQAEPSAEQEPTVESPLPAGEAPTETSVPPVETSVPAAEPIVPEAEPSAPSESPATQPTAQAPAGEPSTQPEASEQTPSAETTVPPVQPSVPSAPEVHTTGLAPTGEPEIQPEASQPTPSAETTVPSAEPSIPLAEPSIPVESAEAQPTGQAPGGELNAEPETLEPSEGVGAPEEPTAVANAGSSEAGERIAPSNAERVQLRERRTARGTIHQLPIRVAGRISAEVAESGSRASRPPKGRTEPTLATEHRFLPGVGSTADELPGRDSGQGRVGFLVAAGASTSVLLAALVGALILRAGVRRRRLADVPPALAHASARPFEQGSVGAADVAGDAVRTPLDIWLDELLSGKPTGAGSHSTGAHRPRADRALRRGEGPTACRVSSLGGRSDGAGPEALPEKDHAARK